MQVREFVVHLHVVVRYVALIGHGDGVSDDFAQFCLAGLVRGLHHFQVGIQVIGFVFGFILAFRLLGILRILGIRDLVCRAGGCVQHLAGQDVVAGHGVGSLDDHFRAHGQVANDSGVAADGVARAGEDGQAFQLIHYLHARVVGVAVVLHGDGVGDDFAQLHHVRLIGGLGDGQAAVDGAGFIGAGCVVRGSLGMLGILGIRHGIRLACHVVGYVTQPDVVGGDGVGGLDGDGFAHRQLVHDGGIAADGVAFAFQNGQLGGLPIQLHGVGKHHVVIRHVAVIGHGDGVGDGLAYGHIAAGLIGCLGHRHGDVHIVGFVIRLALAVGGLGVLGILGIRDVIALGGSGVQDGACQDVIAGHGVGGGEGLHFANRQLGDGFVQVREFVVHLHVVVRYVALIGHGDGVGDDFAQLHLAGLVGGLDHFQVGVHVGGFIRHHVAACRGLGMFGILGIRHGIRLAQHHIDYLACQHVIAGHGVGGGEDLLSANRQHRDGFVQVRQVVVHLHVVQGHIALVGHGDGVGDGLIQVDLLILTVGFLDDEQLSVHVRRVDGIGCFPSLAAVEGCLYHVGEGTGQHVIAGDGIGCFHRRRCAARQGQGLGGFAVVEGYAFLLGKGNGLLCGVDVGHGDGEGDHIAVVELFAGVGLGDHQGRINIFIRDHQFAIVLEVAVVAAIGAGLPPKGVGVVALAHQGLAAGEVVDSAIAFHKAFFGHLVIGQRRAVIGLRIACTGQNQLARIDGQVCPALYIALVVAFAGNPNLNAAAILAVPCGNQ